MSFTQDQILEIQGIIEEHLVNSGRARPVDTDPVPDDSVPVFSRDGWSVEHEASGACLSSGVLAIRQELSKIASGRDSVTEIPRGFEAITRSRAQALLGHSYLNCSFMAAFSQGRRDRLQENDQDAFIDLIQNIFVVSTRLKLLGSNPEAMERVRSFSLGRELTLISAGDYDPKFHPLTGAPLGLTRSGGFSRTFVIPDIYDGESDKDTTNLIQSFVSDVLQRGWLGVASTGVSFSPS